MKIKDILINTVTAIDSKVKSLESDNINTGYFILDNATSGFKPGELIIIGGRPSMGKTIFALNIAENIALSHKERSVIVFSMEMPVESITMRILASLGRVEQTKIRSGKLEEQDWERFGAAVKMLSSTNLFITDDPQLTIAKIITCIENTIEKTPELGLIVIDYLQLMDLDDSCDSRHEELCSILRKLKRIARQYNVPVVLLSQLNRELEKRPNKRPVMSDLRDCGAIEEIADLILFIYRDEVYYEDSPDKGLAEIIVAKQRNGDIGILKFRFEGRYSRFDNLAPEYYQA